MSDQRPLSGPESDVVVTPPRPARPPIAGTPIAGAPIAQPEIARPLIAIGHVLVVAG